VLLTDRTPMPQPVSAPQKSASDAARTSGDTTGEDADSLRKGRKM
jgi:hypothetical protein